MVPVIATSCNRSFEKMEIHLFPNPAASSVNVSVKVEQEGSYMLLIRNVLGEVVLEKSVTFAAGTNLATLSLEKLSAGMHWVGISYKGQQVSALPLVIDF